MLNFYCKCIDGELNTLKSSQVVAVKVSSLQLCRFSPARRILQRKIHSIDGRIRVVVDAVEPRLRPCQMREARMEKLQKFKQSIFRRPHGFKYVALGDATMKFTPSSLTTCCFLQSESFFSLRNQIYCSLTSSAIIYSTLCGIWKKETITTRKYSSPL